jgi:hypothetical protein
VGICCPSKASYNSSAMSKRTLTAYRNSF